MIGFSCPVPSVCCMIGGPECRVLYAWTSPARLPIYAKLEWSGAETTAKTNPEGQNV